MLAIRFGIFEENVSITACPSRNLELNQCYLF